MARDGSGRRGPEPLAALSRRERQIMDILFRRGTATAAEIQEELPDPPGYSAVRSALRLLAEKGRVRHRRDGRRYVYAPSTSPKRVRSKALKHVLETFFQGSRTEAVSALMEARDFRITDREYDELVEMLERARERGPKVSR